MRRLDLLDAAVEAFGVRLSTVDTTQWGCPTPCRAWTIGDLVGHVVAGNRLAVELLGGASRSDVAGLGGPDDLGFGSTAEQQRRAFTRADLDVSVDHPAGLISVAEFVVYRAADITVHAWDLARALGAEERLPEELIEHALVPYARWVATLRVEGMFGSGPSGEHPDSLQDRVLDRLGRRP